MCYAGGDGTYTSRASGLSLLQASLVFLARRERAVEIAVMQLGARFFIVVALLGGASARAQGGVVETPGGGGGCVNSPENPTALLAIAGAAGGVFAYALARRRVRKGK